MAVGAERQREIRTLPPDIVAHHLGRIHFLRDAALTLMTALTIVGATSLLGVHDGTSSASAAGYDTQLAYPRITRGGLSADLQLRIARHGGFGGAPVTVALTKDYLDLYDIQQVFPAPVRATSDAASIYWTFEPPPGEVLDVTIPCETAESLNEVGVHDAELRVLAGGTVVTGTTLSTVVVP